MKSPTRTLRLLSIALSTSGLLVSSHAALAEVASPAAIFLEDGEIELPSSVGEPVAVMPFEEKLIVQYGPSTLALVNPKSERIEWLHSVEEPISYFGVNPSGHLIVADGSLAAYDVSTRQPVWIYPLALQTLRYADDRSALVSGFGESPMPVRFNFVDLETGKLRWPTWGRVAKIHAVSRNGDTLFIHPDERPGWAFEVSETFGRYDYLHAVSIYDVASKPAPWQVRASPDAQMVFTNGQRTVNGLPLVGDEAKRGEALGLAYAGPAPKWVSRRGDRAAILDRNVARTFQSHTVSAAFQECAQHENDETQMKCIQQRARLTNRMGVPAAGFLAALQSIIDSKQQGELTPYVAVSGVEQIASMLILVDDNDRAEPIEAITQFADTLESEGDDHGSYRVVKAVALYTGDERLKRLEAKLRVKLLEDSQ